VYRSRVDAMKQKYGSVSIAFAWSLWDATIAENILVVCKTPMARSITKRTLAGFRNTKVNAQYYPNLIKNISECPEAVVNTFRDGKRFWKINQDTNMKLDAIVGNPPYQQSLSSEKTINNGGFGTAIYPLFIEIGCKLKPCYLSMITPSRWMVKVGQGISDEWVNKMLACNHYIMIKDYLDANVCFQGVEIKGGVNYFLYSASYTGMCKYILQQNGIDYEKNEYLDGKKLGVVIRDVKAKDIISKIINIESDYFISSSFSSMVSPKHYFDRDELLSSNWRGYVIKKDSEHNVKFYLNRNLEKSGFGWIRLADIPKGLSTLPLHKVYIPKAGGSGTDPYVLGKPFYGEPNSVCSYTYLVIGYDKEKHHLSETECKNLITYIKKRLFRYLVSI
jgi:hypothetical protein